MKRLEAAQFTVGEDINLIDNESVRKPARPPVNMVNVGGDREINVRVRTNSAREVKK